MGWRHVDCMGKRSEPEPWWHIEANCLFIRYAFHRNDTFLWRHGICRRLRLSLSNSSTRSERRISLQENGARTTWKVSTEREVVAYAISRHCNTLACIYILLIDSKFLFILQIYQSPRLTDSVTDADLTQRCWQQL